MNILYQKKTNYTTSRQSQVFPLPSLPVCAGPVCHAEYGAQVALNRAIDSSISLAIR